VPKIILLPIMILMLGTGVTLYAGQGALSAVFPVAIGMVTAVRTIPPVYLRVGRSFGLGPARMVAMVWAPASAGQIFTALRIGLANAIVSSLLAETVIGNQGLGYRAVRYYATLEIPQMYAMILLLFVAAMLVNIALERLIVSRTRHFEDTRVVRA
jgi:ABC-type nitrate/sulfonate/bicarbonate transport system permease component